MTVLIGFVLSPLLGLAAYGASVGIVSEMMKACRADYNAGDGFIFVILVGPAVLAVGATAITYTIVNLLIQRDWSIYVAVVAAIAIIPIIVVVAINSQFNAVPSEFCPTGIPPWWPWQPGL